MESRNASDFRTRIEQMQSFGEVSGNEARKLLFRFKDPNEYVDTPTELLKNEVEDIVSNCSCSQPLVTNEGVEVTYTNKTSVSDEMLAIYPDGRMPHETTLTLYMKDGKPLKKLDERTGQMKYNQDKAKVTLFVYGTIVRKVDTGVKEEG